MGSLKGWHTCVASFLYFLNFPQICSLPRFPLIFIWVLWVLLPSEGTSLSDWQNRLGTANAQNYCLYMDKRPQGFYSTLDTLHPIKQELGPCSRSFLLSFLFHLLERDEWNPLQLACSCQEVVTTGKLSWTYNPRHTLSSQEQLPKQWVPALEVALAKTLAPWKGFWTCSESEVSLAVFTHEAMWFFCSHGAEHTCTLCPVSTN